MISMDIDEVNTYSLEFEKIQKYIKWINFSNSDKKYIEYSMDKLKSI